MQESVNRILNALWAGRKGYVFFPYKLQPTEWHETPGLVLNSSPLDPVLHQKADQYFCPVTFSKPQRKKEYAQPTNVLWSDLDYVHPDNCRLRPSIAWESSPGRFQALWFLSTDVSADEASQLSRSIAYADGADKGGWDVTQVLRLPGTFNYKYDHPFEVKLLWAKKSAYAIEEIAAAYPSLTQPVATESTIWPQVPEQSIQLAIASLPIGLRKRLSSSTAGADRSKELQLLARDLLRFGLDSQLILHLLQRSTWNKFTGRSNEHQMLLKQLSDAQLAVSKSKSSQPSTTPTSDVPMQQMQVHSWSGFMQIPTSLRWLVDENWVDQTVGFISGRSKSYKTWIALDMALSIVSGATFLGRYQVRRSGPVLLIQEEDPSGILQERLRLIAQNKGMLPTIETRAAKEGEAPTLIITYPDYPLHIINLQGFSLGVEEKVNQVRELIANLNPVMVILDPLINMLGNIDENRATEVAQVLQSVKMWREEFGCSVLIVHHWNKGSMEDGERMAQHMYGSFAFHAWLESALHVMPLIPEDAEGGQIDTVVIEPEFKAAPSGFRRKIKFVIDSVKKYTYEVEFEDRDTLSPTEQQLLDMIASGGAMTTPELVAATGHARPKVSEAVNRLVRIKLLMGRKGGGRGQSSIYWLPDMIEPPKTV